MRRVTRETGEQQWLAHKGRDPRRRRAAAVLVMTSRRTSRPPSAPEIGQRLLVEAGRLLSRHARPGGRRSRRSPSSWCRRSRTGAGSTCPAPRARSTQAAVAHLDPGARRGRPWPARRYPVHVDDDGRGPRCCAPARRCGSTTSRPRRCCGGRRREHLEMLRGSACRRCWASRCGPARTSSACYAWSPPSRTGASTTPTRRSPQRSRAGSARRCGTRGSSATAREIAHVLSAGLRPDRRRRWPGCEVGCAVPAGRRGRRGRRRLLRGHRRPRRRDRGDGRRGRQGRAGGGAQCGRPGHPAHRGPADRRAARRARRAQPRAAAARRDEPVHGRRARAAVRAAGHGPPAARRPPTAAARARRRARRSASTARCSAPSRSRLAGCACRARARGHARALHGRRLDAVLPGGRALRRGAAGGARGGGRAATRRRSSPRSRRSSRDAAARRRRPAGDPLPRRRPRCSRAARSARRGRAAARC